MDTVLGIEVGASKLTAATARGAVCQPLPDATVASDVWFSQHGPVAGGAAGAPEDTCARWLWLLGKRAHACETEALANVEAMALTDDGHGGAAVRIGGEARAPAMMAQLSLAYVVDEAQRAGVPADAHAVLTAPAAFDAPQLEALKNAAQRAGLRVDRVIADTTAVVIGALEDDFEGMVVAIHLGAGHAEAAVADVSPGMLHVIARVSDPFGGVDTLDHRLVDWLFESVERETGERSSDPRWRAVVLAQIRMMRGLDFIDRTVSVPFLEGVGGRGKDAEWELSPGWIRSASKPMAERLTLLVRTALEEAGIDAREADRVVVLGDGAQIDRVRDSLKTLFPQGYSEADPTLGAQGAARHGAALQGACKLRLVHEEPTVTLPDPLSASGVHARPTGRASSSEFQAVSAAQVVTSRAPVSTIPAAPRVPVVQPTISSRPPMAISPSSAPPAISAGPPSRPSSLALGVTMARSGRFRGAVTIDQVRAMPLAVAPGAEYAQPFHLSYILIALSNQRDLTGKLTLRHKGESVEVALYQGAPTLTTAERGRVPRAFLWPEGEYSFAPEAVVPSQTREREPMLTLVAACIKPMLRGLNTQDMLASFGEKLDKAPVIAADRHTRVQRLALTQVEARMVEHDFQGKQSLREMVESSPLGRQSLIVLVFVMELFGALQWPEPVRPAHMMPLAQLEREVARLRTKNHFDLIGAHWSASPALLQETYDKFLAEFGPTSRWHKASPALCRQALDLGVAAWAVLSNDVQRLAYRKATYPDIDTELLAPLLASRAKSLSMRGDNEGVDEMSRLLRELSPAQAIELRKELSDNTAPKHKSVPPPRKSTPPDPKSRPPGR